MQGKLVQGEDAQGGIIQGEDVWGNLSKGKCPNVWGTYPWGRCLGECPWRKCLGELVHGEYDQYSRGTHTQENLIFSSCTFNSRASKLTLTATKPTVHYGVIILLIKTNKSFTELSLKDNKYSIQS